jgi:4-hydroxybenzoate polyprenyltransferase
MNGESYTKGVDSAQPKSGRQDQTDSSKADKAAAPHTNPRTGRSEMAGHEPTTIAGRGSIALAYELLRSTRPQQWIKNVLVFAGVIFSQQLSNRDAVLASALTFGLFVLASAGIYLVNDLLDIDADRAHPTKRERPLAAGTLPVHLALTAAVVLLSSAIVAAFLMQLMLGAIVALYIGMNLAYSVWLKHVVLLDVILVASGFLLRAAAGVVAVLTPISPWLYLCTMLLALLVLLGKRRSELALLGTRAASHRPNLARYTTVSLDRWLLGVAATTIIAYALYTRFAPATFGDPKLIYTLPFVVLGLVRYLQATRKPGGADSPEALLFRDPWLLASVALWGITVLALLYVV